MTWVVRRATPEDAPLVAAIRVASWRAAYHDVVPVSVLAGMTARDESAEFARAIAEREALGARTWIAEREGAAVGYVAAGPARDDDVPGAGEVYGLYALPDVWGLGAGRAMTRTACGWLAARGYGVAVLWAFEGNDRGRRFYDRGGWTIDGAKRAGERWAEVPEVRYRLGLPRVRVATAEDAPGIAAVHVRGWQVGYRGIIPDDHLDALSVPQRSEGWRSIMRASPPPAIVVAEQGGAIVGFSSGGETRDTDPDARVVGEVSALYVDPERWGGLASDAVLAAMVDELRARRFRAATLWVLAANTRARRFYERHGWVADGASKVEERRSFSLHEVRYRLDPL